MPQIPWQHKSKKSISKEKPVGCQTNFPNFDFLKTPDMEPNIAEADKNISPQMMEKRIREAKKVYFKKSKKDEKFKNRILSIL